MNLFKDLQTSSNDDEKQLGYKLENLFKKRVNADYLLERNGNPLNLDYFKNELKNVQLQSSEALALVSILKHDPPSHRIRI